MFSRRAPRRRSSARVALQQCEPLECRRVPAGAITNDPAYFDRVNNEASFTPLVTAGETFRRTSTNVADGYRMVGVMDGLGMYRGSDGRTHLLVNHELDSPVLTNPLVSAGNDPDDVRGAFVTDLIIDPSTGGVLSADLLFNQVYRWNRQTQQLDDFTAAWLNTATTTNKFNRFCSATLAGTEMGFDRPIWFAGEESGGTLDKQASTFDGLGGESVAIMDGKAYVLSDLGHFARENQVVVKTSDPTKTVIMITEDQGLLDCQLYMYVGTKNLNSADPLLRNGLRGGTLYVFKANAPGTQGEGQFHKADGTLAGQWVAVDPNLPDRDFNATPAIDSLEESVQSANAFDFVRLEDGVASKTVPGRYYFTTTGVNSGPSPDKRGRVYELNFTNLANPAAGATLKVLLEADAGDPIVNPDNLEINELGQLIIQEDVTGENQGNLPGGRESAMWLFDTNTSQIRKLGQAVQSATSAVRPPGPTGAWETSGVVDASGYLGAGKWVFTVMAHGLSSQMANQLQGFATNPNVVEGGQLLVMTVSRDTSVWAIAKTQPNNTVQLERTYVDQNAKALSLTNEIGSYTPGQFLSAGTIQADNWGQLKGTIVSNEIRWSNGSVWVKVPDLSGTYLVGGQTAKIVQDGVNLTFTNAAGQVSSGRFTSNIRSIVATGFGLTGTVTNGVITFSNQQVWQKLPDLTGDYLNAKVDQTGVTITINFGQAHARFLDNKHIFSDEWNLSATILSDRIVWANGVTWQRLPNLNAFWFDGSPNLAKVQQQYLSTTLTNGSNVTSAANFQNNVTFTAPGFGGLVGTIQDRSRTIVFNNNTRWNRLVNLRALDELYIGNDEWPYT